ncbi:MAG: hypothetical protein AAF938_09775 [Myxococcota bacterium]
MPRGSAVLPLPPSVHAGLLVVLTVLATSSTAFAQNATADSDRRASSAGTPTGRGCLGASETLEVGGEAKIEALRRSFECLEGASGAAIDRAYARSLEAAFGRTPSYLHAWVRRYRFAGWTLFGLSHAMLATGITAAARLESRGFDEGDEFSHDLHWVVATGVFSAIFSIASWSLLVRARRIVSRRFAWRAAHLVGGRTSASYRAWTFLRRARRLRGAAYGSGALGALTIASGLGLARHRSGDGELNRHTLRRSAWTGAAFGLGALFLWLRARHFTRRARGLATARVRPGPSGLRVVF